MAISKATIAGDVFSTFYNLSNSNISNPHGTSKWIFSEMPDSEFDDDTDYPIIIIPPVEVSWEEFTMDSKRAVIEVSIDVLATRWATVGSNNGSDNYFDEIINLIETSRDTLRSDGLKFIQLASSSNDSYERGKIKVHERGIVFEMEYTFSKTRSY